MRIQPPRPSTKHFIFPHCDLQVQHSASTAPLWFTCVCCRVPAAWAVLVIPLWSKAGVFPICCVPCMPVFLQTPPLGIYPLSFPLHWHINTPALFRWKTAPQSPEPQSQNPRVKCLSRSNTETLQRRRAVGRVQGFYRLNRGGKWLTAHKSFFNIHWSMKESIQDQKAMYNSPCL